MRPQSRALAVAATVIAATTALAGFAIAGTTASSPPGVAAITNPPEAVTTTPAVKPKFITVRVWSGPYQQAFAKTVGAQFTKATGVKVRWDTADEIISYQKIAQQIRAGRRPEADASMQAQQRAYLDAVRGLTLPISSEVAPNMLKGTRAVAAPDGTPSSATTWAYVNPYSVTVTFVARTDKVKPSSLRKWIDITKPEFRRSIVFDQTYSSTAFALAESMGVDPAKNPPKSLDPVWNRLKLTKPNVASIGNGQDVTTALTSGNATVGITCTCNVIAAMRAGAKLKLVAPLDGMYVVGDAYYIHKGIPEANYYYAQVFANYLYSAATQAYLAKDQALVPTVPGTPVPAYMKAQPRVFPLTAAQLKAARAVVAPIALMARYDTQWQLAFENSLK